MVARVEKVPLYNFEFFCTPAGPALRLGPTARSSLCVNHFACNAMTGILVRLVRTLLLVAVMASRAALRQALMPTSLSTVAARRRASKSSVSMIAHQPATFQVVGCSSIGPDFAGLQGLLRSGSRLQRDLCRCLGRRRHGGGGGRCWSCA